ncbi:hypothetical protein HPP92_027478 [Vanilla planifolia]|uniref:Amidase domain-containing protein n=1 Tax=Vanilla planifolia TaxID=51239 RepID=A0A835P8T9_VANPL|nr:hypothetical protein HPP92_027478 [Vanilla planifolia]
MASSHKNSVLLLIIVSFSASSKSQNTTNFDFLDATTTDLRAALDAGLITSRVLINHHLTQIRIHNPTFRAIIELNPDAIAHAYRVDRRRAARYNPNSQPLLGIPILLKDTIATLGPLNTTAGSMALFSSSVPRDAGVVWRLRRAGAIILGKSSMTEWSHFRSLSLTDGWSARGGQGVNPYNATAGTCGSSSGSAIGVALNLAPLALGIETDGSILCPASLISLVGIKPTVGLTSRAGIIAISSRQDTVGPMARTVADAVAVLDVIVGFDPRDAEATGAAARYIPPGGYLPFLNAEGLAGKRVGILRRPFFNFPESSIQAETFAAHFETMKKKGAILVDDLEISNLSTILNPGKSGEATALLAEFKISLNAYLKDLIFSPVRSLADVIAFNSQNNDETRGIRLAEKMAIKRMARLSEQGLEKLMKENSFDAVVFPGARASAVLAIGDFPESPCRRDMTSGMCHLAFPSVD